MTTFTCRILGYANAAAILDAVDPFDDPFTGEQGLTGQQELESGSAKVLRLKHVAS